MTVSIVTPVHNAAVHLPRCLDSLHAQTYDDLQVVLVDDGSTDGSARLCDEAAADDTRFAALHQTCAGPAAARNAGLAAVCGSWVMFVDADDEIDPDYVEKMLVTAVKTGADIVASDCLMVEGTGARRFGMLTPNRLYTDRDALFDELMAGRMPWSLWAKIYRRELFDDLRFDERDYIAEDLDMNARVFARPGLRLATSSLTGYRYHLVGGSVDHSFTTRHLCQFDVFERVVQLVEREGIRTQTSPYVFYEERVLNCLRKAIDADALDAATRRAFSDAFALHRAQALADPAAPRALKLRMQTTRLDLRLYTFLNRIHP